MINFNYKVISSFTNKWLVKKILLTNIFRTNLQKGKIQKIMA